MYVCGYILNSVWCLLVEDDVWMRVQLILDSKLLVLVPGSVRVNESEYLNVVRLLTSGEFDKAINGTGDFPLHLRASAFIYLGKSIQNLYFIIRCIETNDSSYVYA